MDNRIRNVESRTGAQDGPELAYLQTCRTSELLVTGAFLAAFGSLAIPELDSEDLARRGIVAPAQQTPAFLPQELVQRPPAEGNQSDFGLAA
jgi:hypothetical protein